MKSLHSLALVALAGLVKVVFAAEDASYYGCYSTVGTMKEKVKMDIFMAVGACRPACVAGIGFATMAMTKGTACYCGQKLPNDKFKVKDSFCKQPCGGFAQNTCGSRLGEYFSVYLTGLEQDPDKESEAESSTSSSSASHTKSSNSGPSSTLVASMTPSSDKSTATPAPSPISKAGVAASAVVGVLAIIGLAGGVWVFLRKRRRQKVEEEYRKSAAVRGFVQKPASDHRLDPGMVQRRDSVGSIADNQDYSRRILKVTNPDG